MVVRSFLLPCLTALAAASLFAACANAADIADDDDPSDASTSDATVVFDGAASSSGKTSSSGGSSGASSSGGGSSSGGSSSSGGGGQCGDVKINEIRSDSSDFVELYNAGDCDVDMSDYKLVYRKAVGGTTDTTLMASGTGTLGPQEFYLVGASGVSGTQSTMSAELAAAGGNIALKKGSSSIDEVAYGTGDGSYGEGEAAPSPGSGSIGRTPDGHDTDDNSADFVAGDATPGDPND